MDYSYIKDNYNGLVNDIRKICETTGRNPDDISLVAVSKTFPSEQISYLNTCGHIDFGENRVQDLRQKHNELNQNDIRWHLVGHLQTNKVKYIIDFIHLIHSIDSLKLAQEINKYSGKIQKATDILIQVNTSNEPQKSGIAPNEVNSLCRNISSFEYIRMRGLMTIGLLTDDEELIRENFKLLKNIFDELSPLHNTFKYLSMGMTLDYKIALEEGSNMLRIGSAIFGKRQ